MKLWVISQDVNNDYDTYDSAVVCALTEEDARCITPNGKGFDPDPLVDVEGQTKPRYYGVWCPYPHQVKVKYIGEAAPDVEPGVVLASFNAG